MGFIREVRKDIEHEALRLMREYYSMLLAEAKRLCGDDQTAEDLAMKAIETYLAKPEDELPPEDKTGAWLRATLRNHYQNSIRSKARACTVYVDQTDAERLVELGPVDNSTDEAILAHSDAELVRSAIARLPSDVRSIIMLRYFESLSIREIAEIIRRSPDSVRSNLYYARKVLAKRLAKTLGRAAPAIAALLFGWSLLYAAAVATGLAPSPFAGQTPSHPPRITSHEPTMGTDPAPAATNHESRTTNHETQGDSPQQFESITVNSNANNEENAMNTQLVKSVARTFAAAALAAAPLAATQVRAEQNTLYYCGGRDAEQTSSLTGTGASQGWAETPGGTRMYAGMQSNATHVVFGDGDIRTVTASTAAPSGSTLVFSNCLGRIVLNIPQYVSVPTVTIGSLEVVSGSEVLLPVWGGIKDSSAPGGYRRAYPTWAGDDWFIETGSSVKFQLNTACWAGFNCTAVIRGGAGSSLKAETVHYDTSQFTLVSNTLRLSGNLSGYSGDLVVGSVGDQPGFARMELVNEYSIPSDPPVAQTAYVVVTNGATLIVDQDWTSGRNRVWDFGSGEPSTIYVAEGKTVTIKGEVRGSVGFRKSGPGTLVLTKQSPISGACEVISGKVLLQGDAAALKLLFAVYGEYLDAPCSSYINTQYKPNNNTRIVMDLTVQGAREYWYGVWDRAYNNGSFLAANDGAAAGVVHFGFGNTFNNGPSLLSNGRHVVDFDKGVLWIDNAGKYEASSTSSFQLSNNLYLFLINKIGTPYVHDDEQGTIRMHSCRIYDNGTLVRDYTPRQRNGEWMLYEARSGSYVGNSGAGTFGGGISDSLEVIVGSVYYLR